jgi:hypothetical protein
MLLNMQLLLSRLAHTYAKPENPGVTVCAAYQKYRLRRWERPCRRAELLAWGCRLLKRLVSKQTTFFGNKADAFDNTPYNVMWGPDPL